MKKSKVSSKEKKRLKKVSSKEKKRLKKVSLIKKYAKQGLSANKTLAKLKSKGLGMRKQFFLNNYRAAKGTTKKKDTSKYTPKKYDIPLKDYRPSVIKSENVNYRYFLEVDRFNTLTESYERTFAQIDSSKKLTKKQLQNNVDILYDPIDGQSGDEDLINPTIISIDPTYKANQKEADKIHKDIREENKKKKDKWINVSTEKEFKAQMKHRDRLIKKKQKELSDLITEQKRIQSLRK